MRNLVKSYIIFSLDNIREFIYGLFMLFSISAGIILFIWFLLLIGVESPEHLKLFSSLYFIVPTIISIILIAIYYIIPSTNSFIKIHLIRAMLDNELEKGISELAKSGKDISGHFSNVITRVFKDIDKGLESLEKKFKLNDESS